MQIGVGEMAKAWRGVEEGFSWEDALGEVKDSILTTLWSGIGTSSPTVRFGVDVADARRGGGAAWLHDQRLAAASEQEQAILGDLDTLAQESKLAQRDPILYEDAMRTLAQGGTVNTVYIPATGLAAAYGEDGGQGVQPVLEALGVSLGDFQDAYFSGGDVAVPLATYAATVASNKEFAVRIAEHRRLSPDGYTVNELRQWHKDNQEGLETMLADAAASTEHTHLVEQEGEEVFFAAKEMLVASGVESTVATANATQFAAFFTTVAQRTGTTPRQLWDSYAPNVQGQNGRVVEAGEALFPKGNTPPAAQAMEARVLAQPVNPGVDLEGPVQAVRVEPQFTGKKYWEMTKGSIPRELKKVAGVYTNKATGWAIELTRKGVAHAAASVSRAGAEHVAHMEAVANLPALIEHAVLVESHPDKKGQGLNSVHRMYAGMHVGGDAHPPAIPL